MFRKSFFYAVCFLFAGLPVGAQSSIPLTIKFQNARAIHFKIECTIEGVTYEIDDNGSVLHVCQQAENASLQDDSKIIFWQPGWSGKEGKVKSVYNTELDYWTPGWGEEKVGKLKSIGGLLFEYWAPGWGKEKEGKLKSVGNIPFDYWAPGWGKEKEGKIKQIGSSQFDYWAPGWGTKEGRLKSIEGKDPGAIIWMPVL